MREPVDGAGLEIWKAVPEKKMLGVNRSNTEYLVPSGSEDIRRIIASK